MRLYIRFIISHRLIVIGLLFLITFGALLSLYQGTIASSMSNFLGDSSAYQDYQKRIREFSNDEIIIIAVEDEAPLSLSSITRLELVVRKLKKLKGVRRVHSILDAREMKVTADVLTLDNYVAKAKAQPEQVSVILDQLINDTLARDLFISDDGEHTVVLIELTSDAHRGAETYPKLIKEIVQLFTAAGLERARIHQAGMISVLAEVMYQTEFNIVRLFPIVCVVLLVTVFLMFRRLWPVIITAIVAFTGVIWTMGLAVLLFQKINVLIALAPLFILIISFSDVVHLCSSYLLELAGAVQKEEAIENACCEVGTACFFTSLTTFAGFIALVVVPTPISRQMGIILGVGVALSLLIALTLTPILFSIMKKPKPWRTGSTSHVQKGLDAALRTLASLAAKRPRLILLLFTGLMIVALVGIYQVEFELDFAKRFAESNHIRVDERYFARHFAGTNYLNIYIETTEDEGMLDPQVFRKIAAFQESLLGFPEIDKIVSFVDVITQLHHKFHPEDQENMALPETREALAQYLLLLEMSDLNDLERMIDFERTTLCLSVHLTDKGIMSTQKTGDEAMDAARKILGENLNVEVLSLKYLLGKEFDKLFLSGQKKALLVAMITVLIMMIIALKSIPDGLWSMFPNAIPLFFLGGYLGWWWDTVDTDVLIAFMVALGIGVDDTIHFLMRYRLEYEKSRNRDLALEKTFHYSGRAIVITSIILVAGFLPLALSSYLTVNIMGTLLPGCLLVALVADLLLVPALIKLGIFGGTR
ncbi:RND family transporter [candidate division CSSED10-310 bacterium]|uniref:RND family transporter n=1 Tax=candidate division CSSED10-310 bacterium TaxID=2855610 RepID=A0ABV6YTV3_UNCC1